MPDAAIRLTDVTVRFEEKQLAFDCAIPSGAAIAVELWDIPLARFGEFVAEIPSPLGIGSLELCDGRWVKGFICEPAALNDAVDITEFKGWRHWVARKENHHV